MRQTVSLLRGLFVKPIDRVQSLYLLGRVLLVNKVFVPFESTFVVNLECNTKPSLVNYGQLMIPLPVSTNSPQVIIAFSTSRVQFTLCIDRPFHVDRLLQCHISTQLLQPAGRVNRGASATIRESISRTTRSFRLIDELLMHLLSPVSLFARQGILKLFYVLIQKFFLRFLLMFVVIVLICDLLNDRIDPFLSGTCCIGF